MPSLPHDFLLDLTLRKLGRRPKREDGYGEYFVFVIVTKLDVGSLSFTIVFCLHKPECHCRSPMLRGEK